MQTVMPEHPQPQLLQLPAWRTVQHMVPHMAQRMLLLIVQRIVRQPEHMRRPPSAGLPLLQAAVWRGATTPQMKKNSALVALSLVGWVAGNCGHGCCCNSLASWRSGGSGKRWMRTYSSMISYVINTAGSHTQRTASVRVPFGTCRPCQKQCLMADACHITASEPCSGHYSFVDAITTQLLQSSLLR